MGWHERSSEKRDSNPDLHDAGAVLQQYNWEHVVMWVDYKPVDVEIQDDNTGIFHVFERPIGIIAKLVEHWHRRGQGSNPHIKHF